MKTILSLRARIILGATLWTTGLFIGFGVVLTMDVLNLRPDFSIYWSSGKCSSCRVTVISLAWLREGEPGLTLFDDFCRGSSHSRRG